MMSKKIRKILHTYFSSNYCMGKSLKEEDVDGDLIIAFLLFFLLIGSMGVGILVVIDMVFKTGFII